MTGKSKVLTTLSLMAVLTLPLSAAPASAESRLESGVPVVASIGNAGNRAAAVARIHKVPSVSAVNLRIRLKATRLLREDDPVAEYRLYASRNASGIARLQSALRNNPATRAALADHGISISRIVAVDVFSNGAIKVYLL